MNLISIIVCVFTIGVLLLGSISILIWWALFRKDYYTALGRYKELVNSASVDDLHNVYNKEFPADFSAKEIQDWVKEGKDDTNHS